MKKTRFFKNRKRVFNAWHAVLVLMLCLMLLLDLTIKQADKNQEIKTVQVKHETETGQEQIKNETAGNEAAENESADPKGNENSVSDPGIRVLLSTTDFTSYFHSLVTLSYGGKETSYTPEEVASAEDGRIRIPEQEGGIQLTSVSRQCGNPVYKGSLELRAADEGILVINQLSLEEYLKSVVPSEMPSSYRAEALKAQAVCARTYAVRQRREHRMESYGADVDDSVSYQVYGNIEPQESTSAAVLSTEGQILCQDGEPIEAFYFSTSAGVTSTNTVWGAAEAASYLKSVPCTFDSQQPWSRWQVEIPWSTLSGAAASQMGKECSLLDLVVTKKQESGAVTGLRVVTDAGSFTLDTESSIRQFLSPEGCTITEKDGTKVLGGSLLPSAYFNLSLDPGNSVAINGGGYGHGVGMSQTAANEMAAEGYLYTEILDYFFNGTELLTTD